MFKKLFGGKSSQKDVTIVAPLTGQVVPIENVPDPVFSQKMMGNGFAIEPTNGQVVSPVDGEVIQLFHTKHAIGLKTDAGVEVLIHIGLETVAMNGEGFEAHVSQGDKVKVGTPLVTFDLNLVKEKAKSTVTPVVITNTDNMESFEMLTNGSAEKGSTPCLKVVAK